MVKILASSTVEKSCRAQTAEKNHFQVKALQQSSQEKDIYLYVFMVEVSCGKCSSYKDLLLDTAVKQS